MPLQLTITSLSVGLSISDECFKVLKDRQNSQQFCNSIVFIKIIISVLIEENSNVALISEGTIKLLVSKDFFCA